MTGKNDIHVLSRAVIIDGAHILLCKTVDLATNFYFLPGGHVEHGESIETSLIRELIEETGAQCQVKRLLGCLEHSFEPSHSSICHNHEYNFIFEVASHSLTVNQQIPRLEAHIELIWMSFDELSTIDFRPAPLKQLIPKWLELPVCGIFHSEMSWVKPIERR